MRTFVLTTSLLLLAVVSINGLATWDAERQDRRFQAAAAGLVPGQAVIVTRELDDRRLHRMRLQVIPRPAVVAFGSSRIMPLSGAALGLAPGQFYNTAVSAASVEDHIAFWQLLKQGDRVPDIAIFSIDHWALARSQEQVRWLALSREVSEFLDGAGRGTRGWAPLHTWLYRWARFKELFSYSVLKASVADLERIARSRGRRGADVVASLRRDVVAEREVAGRRAVRADGSLIYDRAFDDQPAEQVREEAVRFARAGARGLAEFRVDPERLARLELLWRDMRAQGVELVVYLPPYHPAAWALIRAEPRAAAALADSASAVARLASRMGARFLDASDPASIPCEADRFYDGDHARVECLHAVIARLLSAPQATEPVRATAVGAGST